MYNPDRQLRASYMLGQKHFMVVLGFAVFLHVAGFVGWSLAPKQEVQNIIIHKMNIRFGELEEISEPDEALPNTSSQDGGIATVNRAAIISKTKKKETAKKPTKQIPRQYVREVEAPSKKNKGSKEGKSKEAEVLARYTQLISNWNQKFYVYPKELRAQGIKGDAIIRISIDRRGNLRYYELEKSTGNELLDKAAINMVRRANPMPAVPDDITGEMRDFLIPVNFK